MTDKKTPGSGKKSLNSSINSGSNGPSECADFWSPYAAYYTTGQFFRLKKGFKNHCGPTAITNIIMSLKSRQEALDAPRLEQRAVLSAAEAKQAAKETFLEVATYGIHHLLYLNINLFHFYGGTSDVLSGIYLRQMLQKQGIRHVRVSLSRPLAPSLVRRSLDRGSILYIMLIHHKKYKNHHLICYGYSRSDDGSFRYLTADGWASSPTYLTDRDFRLGLFREIHP